MPASPALPTRYSSGLRRSLSEIKQRSGSIPEDCETETAATPFPEQAASETGTRSGGEFTRRRSLCLMRYWVRDLRYEYDSKWP